MKTEYELYQRARDESWRCLIKHDISELPISITALLRAENIRYGSYGENEIQLHKNGLGHLMGNDGFTLMDHNERISVYFNEKMPTQRCRFTLAHELGHIYLGHLGIPKTGLVNYTVLNREPSPRDNPWEREANIFASRLLAPACVLREIGMKKTCEIAELCGISMTAARFRAERMEVLYQRDEEWKKGERSCFYLSPLEKKVFEQFSGFISKRQS